jgi:hypothetical protein
MRYNEKGYRIWTPEPKGQEDFSATEQKDVRLQTLLQTITDELKPSEFSCQISNADGYLFTLSIADPASVADVRASYDRVCRYTDVDSFSNFVRSTAFISDERFHLTHILALTFYLARLSLERIKRIRITERYRFRKARSLLVRWAPFTSKPPPSPVKASWNHFLACSKES